MLNKVLYYLVIIPFAHLPMFILYGVSDLLYVLFLSIFPYRKKVAMHNISLCFPELNEKEKRRLVRKNYRHLSDIMAEGIKNLGIGNKSLRKRFVIENPEIFDRFFEERKSVVLISSHYSNWEYLILAQNLLIRQRAIGIGKPLSRSFLNNKINALRERNGMKVVSAKNYKEEISARLESGELMAILALADQAPAPENAYWTKFFNIESPFSFGPEYLAHQFDFPVVFLKTHRLKRGHYSSVATLLTENPRKGSYGDIMEKYARLLEDQIREKPAHWLWTHKRWKHAIPENIDQVKKSHREFFNKRFGKAEN